MSMKVFLHGVPDTPAMWGPLLGALALPESEVAAPALPGFACDIPAGFNCTKEAYVDWFIGVLEELHAAHGPSDVVGHDWGALITTRAASLRPDLFNSWTIANAAPHPDYKWHRTARMWQTPLLGELVNFLIKPKAMQAAFTGAGFPADLAREEASHFDKRMKRAILALYRSAKQAGAQWDSELSNMPARGLVFWGDDDPYVPVWVADKFATRTGVNVVHQPGVGHWSIVEKPDVLAAALRAHWQA